MRRFANNLLTSPFCLTSCKAKRKDFVKYLFKNQQRWCCSAPLYTKVIVSTERGEIREREKGYLRNSAKLHKGKKASNAFFFSGYVTHVLSCVVSSTHKAQMHTQKANDDNAARERIKRLPVVALGTILRPGSLRQDSRVYNTPQ